MVSISAHTFEFARVSGSSISVFRYRGKKGLAGEYTINFHTGDAWRAGLWKTVPLPHKMKGALIVAALLYNRANQHIRPKWRPRLG